jgi:hypothetical protein
MTDTGRKELTAAELDLVAGGFLEVTLADCMISGFMAPRNGETTSAGTGNDNGSAVYDIRQSKTV